MMLVAHRLGYPILTARIKEVTEHLKANKHDHMARRGLIQMVGEAKAPF